MSWGFFLDVRLDVPDREWKRLQGLTAKEFPIPPGWWGFEDRELESEFSNDELADWSFATAIAARQDSPETVCSLTSVDETTSIRVSCLLDRGGQLSMARPFASLVEAARTAGGAGKITLVNDGTYAGEGGRVVALAKGKLTTKRIRDPWPLVETLGREIYGDELDEDDEEVEP